MWINIIRDKDKPLSAVELLVLTSVPEIPTKATDVMDQMNKKSIHWIAEKGSVYPILHRLTERGLLNIQDKMIFSRSAMGSSLLLSSFNEIMIQFESVISYFQNISENLVETDPLKSRSLLEKLSKSSSRLISDIDKLIIKSDEVVKRDNWKQLTIE